MIAEPTFNLPVAEEALERTGFGAVLSSPFLRRLRGVSFLSTLDYVYNINAPSNRYEHSVCTAKIALDLAQHLGLGKQETNVLVLANLIHDIGHAPFSHNSEPFLLEQRGLYHNGVAKTYLRHPVRSGFEQISLYELLERFHPDAIEQVAQLMMQKTGANFLVESLFRNGINCDKIEGTNRTLISLGMDHIDPSSLVQCFELRQDRIFVPRASIPLLLSFWDLQKKAYWERIYTHEVFAAEAMITRALERVYATKDKVSRFMFSEDSDVFAEALTDSVAKKLIECTLQKKFMVPLSIHVPDVFYRIRDAMFAARFDKERRRVLERNIADELGLEADFVVSHFSLRKQFFTDYSLLFQPSLFEDNPSVISLAQVEKALTSSKTSGDFFEVYFMLT